MSKSITQSFLLILVALLLGACAFGGHNAPGGKGSYDVMVVQKEPATFGYERLMKQSAAHPDLTVFVKKRGVPDFLAETSTDERRYFILYYLNARMAFVCRTSTMSSRDVEFSGPYPITPKEYKLLHGFRETSRRKMAKP